MSERDTAHIWAMDGVKIAPTHLSFPFLVSPPFCGM